jgi:hypothetical protein
MIKLRYCVTGAYMADVKLHPQKEMARLGITYKDCEALPIGDCWVFYECSSLPNELPAYLRIIKQ